MILKRTSRNKERNGTRSVLDRSAHNDSFSSGRWKYWLFLSTLLSCIGYYTKPGELSEEKPGLTAYVDVSQLENILDEKVDEVKDNLTLASHAIENRREYIRYVESVVNDIAVRWNAVNYADFYLAQIYVESEFYPNATSKDNACGIAQVTKEEFDVLKKTMVRRVNKWHKTDNTFDHEWDDTKYDLELNAEAGFIIFLYNRHKARGVLDNALAMYNAGRTRIFNAMNRKKTRDLDVYKSVLPKATREETIPYVKNVRSLWSRIKEKGVEDTIIDIEKYRVFVSGYHRLAEQAMGNGDVKLALRYWEDLWYVTSDRRSWHD